MLTLASFAWEVGHQVTKCKNHIFAPAALNIYSGSTKFNMITEEVRAEIGKVQNLYFR